MPWCILNGIRSIPGSCQTKEWSNDMPLEVRVYGSAKGTFTLYDDDGKTFDFEKGKYTTKLLSVENDQGTVTDKHSNGPWSYGNITWKFMSK